MYFSLNNVKKNLRWISYFVVCIFQFIFLAMPVISVAGYGAKGYDVLDLEGVTMAGDLGILSFLLKVLNIIAIVLIVLFAYRLTVEFFGRAIKDAAHFELPMQLGPVSIERVTNIIWILYMIANVVAFAFNVLIALVDGNQYIKIAPGIGAYLMLIFSIGTPIALKVLTNKFPAIFAASRAPRFGCEQCGAPAHAVGFCQQCGGRVVELAPEPIIIHVCERCGNKAKAGVAFCAKCGGRIVDRQYQPQPQPKPQPQPQYQAQPQPQYQAQPQPQYQAQPQPQYQAQPQYRAPQPQQPQYQAPQPQPQAPTFVCSQCGAPAQPGAAFCNHCGGKIIAR